LDLVFVSANFIESGVLRISYFSINLKRKKQIPA